MRTEAERSDQLLSWKRPDRAFFAAGACHILAYRFRETDGTDEGWELIHLRPRPGFIGSHVYVSTGEWVFDFNGWTPEQHFLDETARRCRYRWPDWDFDRVVLTESLESFCAPNRHRLPSQYAFDPIARADAFIQRFSPRPPV
jgi:hypothetical protein